MSNRAIWGVRKRHEWLAKPCKKQTMTRRGRVRIGLQAAMDRKAEKAARKAPTELPDHPPYRDDPAPGAIVFRRFPHRAAANGEPKRSERKPQHDPASPPAQAKQAQTRARSREPKRSEGKHTSTTPREREDFSSRRPRVPDAAYILVRKEGARARLGEKDRAQQPDASP